MLLDFFHQSYDKCVAALSTPGGLISMLGQFIFSLRFLVQWIASERAKKTVVPLSFWYLSLLGAAILLWYGLYAGIPVLIVGPIPGLFIYSRNLILAYKGAGNVTPSGSPT